MNTTAGQFDWNEFCSDDAMNGSLSRSFVRDGFRQASDARIAVAVETDEPETDTSKYSKRKPPDVLRIINEGFPQTGSEIPLPPFMECDVCHGLTTITEIAKCDNCNGTGIEECYHCGNDTDCEECDGTGKAENLSPCDCQSRLIVVLSKRARIGPKYVNLLARHGVKSVLWSGEKDSNVGFYIEIDGKRARGVLCPLVNDQE